jgi:hypothetical protein
VARRKLIPSLETLRHTFGVGLCRSICPTCDHPISTTTVAALEVAVQDHEWHVHAGLDPLISVERITYAVRH